MESSNLVILLPFVALIGGLAITIVIASALSKVVKKKHILELAQAGDTCKICGACPAALLQITALTGKILLTEVQTSNSVLCQNHAKQLLSRVQKHTAAKGWWSWTGLIKTPLTLLYNKSEYNRFKTALDMKSST